MRGWLESTAKGVSSPIEPTASAIFAEHAQDGVQLFRAVVKLFLVAGERVVIQLAAANLFVRRIFERHRATNVFLHPLFIRMAALQIVIGFR